MMNHRLMHSGLFLAPLFTLLLFTAASLEVAPAHAQDRKAPIRRASPVAPATLSPGASAGAAKSDSVSTSTGVPDDAQVAVPLNPSKNSGGARPPREPVTRASSVFGAHHQFSMMGGFSFDGNHELESDVYKHKAEQSPILRLGYHYAFFTDRPVNLLVGGDIIYLHSTEVASSSTATATYTSDLNDMGGTVGFGWSPAGVDTAFQVQGMIGTGLRLSRSAQLKSPGFTTNIKNDRTDTGSNIILWWDLIAVYNVTPNWRVMGGLLRLEETRSLIAGAAYAF